VNHIEGAFKSARDDDIYYQAWLPEGNVRAVLIVVHGIGEHSGRYMNVVNHLVPLGYAVYGFDHVGHGRSGGMREFVVRFDDYTTTLTRYCDLVRSRETVKPVFLLGHSMGGLIASYYLLDHQTTFRGAVLAAPSIKAGASVSPVNILVTKVLSVIAPGARVLALDANGISRDPQVVAAYVRDPLVFHGRTTARVAVELLKAMRRVTAEAGSITLPLLVLQGSGDQHVNPAGAQMLFDKAGSGDKTIRVFEGLHHEVFNEPERAQVLDEVEAWLTAHV
jgi:acylglycerol lipase